MPQVGRLFEIYYYLFSTDTARKRFLQKVQEDKTTTAEEKSKILQTYSLPFAFFVAQAALSRSAGKNNLPMFYMSLIDNYHGLANRAVQVRAAYNSGLALKPLKKLKERAHELHALHTKEAIQRGLVVGAADNFARQYYMSKIECKKQVVQNVNRSVGALSVVPVDLNLLHGDRNLNSLPRPEVLLSFLDKALNAVQTTVRQCTSPGTEPEEWRYYEGAEVTQQAIYTVPLKMPTEEVKRRNLPPHDIGLTHFRPQWVSESNPATNKEAYDMFHKLYETFKPALDENHYIAWRFDLAIYNKFLHVSSLCSERGRVKSGSVPCNHSRVFAKFFFPL